jgi:hypothetical protein
LGRSSTTEAFPLNSTRSRWVNRTSNGEEAI